MSFRPHLQSLKKEPLAHFLLAGLALFAFFAWRGNDVDPASRTILITEEQVAQLAYRWTQTWQRPPSQTEMDGLIQDQVKEEIYYREGLRLGLDQDDAIIRRRIRSKMEFLASSELENQIPDERTLQAWLDRNPVKYASAARYSFDQIYFVATDAGATRARAAGVLATLGNGANWQEQGEEISLPRSVDNEGIDAIARDFGDDFVRALAGLKPGGWTGPIASGFGLHLVRVRKAEASAKPQLKDVRQAVENDWRIATAKERESQAYQALLDSYTIRIAQP